MSLPARAVLPMAFVLGVTMLPSAAHAQGGGPGRLRRTVFVSPVPGNPVASGAALVAALAAITDAAGDNPYLLKIEPGVYELHQTLFLKAHVDVEGSGEGVTTISKPDGFGLPLLVSASQLGAAAPEVRALTLETRGGDGENVTAFYSLLSSPRLSNVTVVAEAAAGSRPLTFDRSSSLLRNITVRGSASAGITLGISAQDASTLEMQDVDLRITGVPNAGAALYVAAGSVVTMRGGRVSGIPAMEGFGRLNASATLVDGAVNTLPGFVVACVGAFDATFTALGSDCR